MTCHMSTCIDGRFLGNAKESFSDSDFEWKVLRVLEHEVIERELLDNGVGGANGGHTRRLGEMRS